MSRVTDTHLHDIEYFKKNAEKEIKESQDRIQVLQSQIGNVQQEITQLLKIVEMKIKERDRFDDLYGMRYSEWKAGHEADD